MVTTATTKRASLVEGAGVWGVYLPLAPVPAARARVGRWGTYYPKTYKRWIREASDLLAPLKKRRKLTNKSVSVLVETVAKRPVRLTRPLPRPDVDNYAKAVLDAITKSELIWFDDDQVQLLITEKRYAQPNEEPHTRVVVAHEPGDLLIPHSKSTGEDVYDLPASRRISLGR